MILTEDLTSKQAHVIVEAVEDNGKKNLFMKGIFMQGGVKNHNERIYPVSEIRKAVENINRQIEEGVSVCGECDHPEELTINLDRVSHVITNMWMEGSYGMGKLKIIPTPMGNIIRTLIESDVKLGVSSRGRGNVGDNGEVSDFEVTTIDIVATPSCAVAFPKKVYESLNSRRGRVIEDLAKAVAHDPKAQKHFKKELLEWINRLND